jgi:hypothetical protein
MASHSEIQSSAKLLDVFRLVPAERDFLLEQIAERIFNDPPQNSKDNGKQRHIHSIYLERQHPHPSHLFDPHTARKCDLEYKGRSGETPHQCGNQPETHEYQELYNPYWDSFLSLSGFCKEREPDTEPLKGATAGKEKENQENGG